MAIGYVSSFSSSFLLSCLPHDVIYPSLLPSLPLLYHGACSTLSFTFCFGVLVRGSYSSSLFCHLFFCFALFLSHVLSTIRVLPLSFLLFLRFSFLSLNLSIKTRHITPQSTHAKNKTLFRSASLPPFILSSISLRHLFRASHNHNLTTHLLSQALLPSAILPLPTLSFLTLFLLGGIRRIHISSTAR